MIEVIIAENVKAAVLALYGQEVELAQVAVEKTNRDVEGDFTVVVFPFLRISRKAPHITAEEIGNFLQDQMEQVGGFNVIKGFLNLSLSNDYWMQFFGRAGQMEQFGFKAPQEEAPVVVEYSSPNTNKPLHLGHIRNNLLGYSVSEILKANGKNVVKVNLVNDRGIHICKSMLAWQKYGNGETPESSGKKGDKLVGDYYVRFDQEYKKEIAALVANGMPKEDAEKQAPLILEAQDMLRKWEAGDETVRSLWEKMNTWVYAGFDTTYKRMGVDFDKTYYESQTYLLGKDLVMQGLEEGALKQKEDGSVWADMREEGLDEKLLLRADGTSVYMTQDLGTAKLRYADFDPQKLIYVVGNEQIYHFEVLKRVLNKVGMDWHDQIYHLSYGMVELPHGKMKSREGTVVDADDLMAEMQAAAKAATMELGKIEDFDSAEAEDLYRMVSLAALKYFILKVDPTKTMMFNPAESIDLNGNTGPFVQYTYARIKSVLRKAEAAGVSLQEAPFQNFKDYPYSKKEKELLRTLHEFPNIIRLAGDNYTPAVIANYVYELAKDFNQFYHDHSILKAEKQEQMLFRAGLSIFIARVIKNGMGLLGIEMPEKM